MNHKKNRHIASPRVLLTLVPVLAGLFFVVHRTLISAAGENLAVAPVDEVEELKVMTPMDSLVATFDTLFTDLINTHGAVGTATVITHNNSIIYQKCTGTTKAGGTDSIDTGTLFRLASVSKPVTGVLAGILHRDSVVRLDDPVIGYLPGFRLKDSISTHSLTVRNLLSHTSGLVPHAYDNLVEAKVSFREIMDSLWRVNLSDIPGRLYGYQNVMFSLYDTIVETRTGQPFKTLIHEKLFRPLGMPYASTGFNPFAESNNKAFPHVRTSSGFHTIKLNDRYYNTIPAAGINASIADMGQFLLAMTTRDPHLLHPQVIDTVITPQVISPLRRVYLRRWNGVESKHYGLGWRIIGYNGCQVAYHGGYVRGYRAEIAFCREQGIGIAFLTNSPGRLGSYVIPAFLDLYFEKMGYPGSERQ